MSENGETRQRVPSITAAMNEIILHHYDLSPYAEKIRVLLGYKNVPWRSVHIPVVMPKPKLTALTGGYRLTPVMQIGADIYCDTKRIAAELERIAPSPSVPATGVLDRSLSHWGESMFMPTIVNVLADGSVLPPGFIEDRDKMIPGGVDVDLARAAAPAMLDQLRDKLATLDEHLADGRAFLLGDTLSLADLSVYHPVWAMMRCEPTSKVAERFARVGAWRERIAAIGHGDVTEMDADDALAIARDATPTAARAASVDPDDPSCREPGRSVAIMPEVYGRDPVAGELVSSNAHEITILRKTDDLGEIAVHFPRDGIFTFAQD